jgi:isochorismate synthase
MVTNYITEALKTRLTGLEVSGTTTVKAGNLWHLCTGISGKLVSGDLQGLVKVLHPTPAVGGVPMVPAKGFILQRENYARGFYTGYLGELNFRETKERTTSRRNMENKAYGTVRNRTTLFVNLRCMQLLHQKALIYVGGGITAGSIPEREWLETVSKSATMLKVLQK